MITWFLQGDAGNGGSGLAREGIMGSTAKTQSNMNSASLLNCASNRLAGIGRPNR